ncbi:MAG TPA: hypothetical protein VM386_03355 [Acidimicrobiales bacterium]|nr:hypothetical protein [Acidimicrobiales bacterium]
MPTGLVTAYRVTTAAGERFAGVDDGAPVRLGSHIECQVQVIRFVTAGGPTRETELAEAIGLVDGELGAWLAGPPRRESDEERPAQPVTAVHEGAIVVEDDGMLEAGGVDAGAVLGDVAKGGWASSEPAILVEGGSARPSLDVVERDLQDG